MWMSWDTNPLYAIMHESIYCQGAASNWAAERVLASGEFADAFDATQAAQAGQPVNFTGKGGVVVRGVCCRPGDVLGNSPAPLLLDCRMTL